MERIKPNKTAFIYVPIIGGIFGIINLTWKFTIISFTAGLFSGFVFGLIMVVLLYTININSKIKFIISLIVSGFVGGICWELIMQSKLNIFLVGIIGSVISLIVYYFEIHLIENKNSE